jgi:hypothetical protein
LQALGKSFAAFPHGYDGVVEIMPHQALTGIDRLKKARGKNLEEMTARFRPIAEPMA